MATDDLFPASRLGLVRDQASVAGLDAVLGIYPGPHGARIEDIVVGTADGCERLSNTPRELVVVG